MAACRLIFLACLAGGLVAITANPTETKPTEAPEMTPTTLTPANDDPAKATDHWRNMKAYDCAAPRGVRAVYVAPPNIACEEEQERQTHSEQKVEVIVAQRTRYRRVTARECQLRETDLAFYCGTYDHETFITELFRSNVPSRVSPSDCQSWHDTNTYETPRGKAMHLLPNSTRYFAYDVWGDHHSEGKCTGASFSGGPLGRTYHRTVVSRHASITISQKTLFLRGNMVIDALDRSIPSCRAGSSSCVSGGRTLVWDQPVWSSEGQCSLFQVRRARGAIRTTEEGERIFVSDDGSALRFRLKEELVECGERIYSTEFEDIVVTQKVDHRPFQRQLPIEEHSAVLTSDVQDAFLDGKAEDAFQDYHRRAQASECRRQQKARKMGYGTLAAEQRAAISGDTIMFGDGHFAVAAGEVWHTFVCRPLTVLAADADDCYTGLPVILQRDDLIRFYHDRDETLPLPGQEEQIFLTPHTHLLSRHAAARPCVQAFAPYYRNAMGRWLQADPACGLADDPAYLHRDFLLENLKTYEASDFGAAGLYTSEAKKLMRDFQVTGMVRGDLGTVMASQAIYNGFGTQGHRGFLTPQDAFAGTLPPSLIADLAAYADSIGNLKTLSVCILISILAIVGSWIGSLYCRAQGGRQHPNINRWWQYATVIFPSCLHVVLKRMGERAKDWYDASMLSMQDGYVELQHQAHRQIQNRLVPRLPAAIRRRVVGPMLRAPMARPAAGPTPPGRRGSTSDAGPVRFNNRTGTVQFSDLPGLTGAPPGSVEHEYGTAPGALQTSTSNPGSVYPPLDPKPKEIDQGNAGEEPEPENNTRYENRDGAGGPAPKD